MVLLINNGALDANDSNLVPKVALNKPRHNRKQMKY